MSDDAFLWALPALAAVAIGFQLYAGRIPLCWTPRGWQIVEKAKDEGRFWLFIIAEMLLVLLLIGQAFSA